ncbi:MAG: PglZ domain-containing protein, partial [Candidatus Delongbacteria bacterium]
MNNLLWVDDEIELLKPHLLYLRRKGYRLSTATNGHDALKMVMENSFDLVILDEMMVGIDGLETLGRIKAVDTSIKAIMVTKSEEEDIFLEAVGNMIDDYLTKPVSPLQLYLSIRKNLEKADIVNESVSKNYIKNYRILTNMIENDPGYSEWINIYKSMVSWSLRLDEINDQNLADTFDDLRNNANSVFGNFIQNEYKDWISDKSRGPVLSTDIVKKYIVPDLGSQKTAFIVIDCLPYDQMKVIEKVLSDRYSISEHLYFSILPTATQFARNAIFSGLFPSQIEERYPDIYSKDLEDEKSSNKHEKELLSQLLRSCGIDFSDKLKYVKIYKNEEFSKLESHIDGYKDSPLIAVVVNMIDFLVHNQKKDELVSEMMENESSY